MLPLLNCLQTISFSLPVIHSTPFTDLIFHAITTCIVYVLILPNIWMWILIWNWKWKWINPPLTVIGPLSYRSHPAMAFLLICKCTYCTFCVGIFNPTTNEFFQVPQGDCHVDFCAFGFGFIPNTKQCKLFRVIISEEPSCIMEVLTFRTSGINPKQNQWRHLYSLPFWGMW